MPKKNSSMQSRPPCPRLSVNETVASEKGKPGVAYVMNSGSLRHGYGAWPWGPRQALAMKVLVGSFGHSINYIDGN
jgi:hypothetical protein